MKKYAGQTVFCDTERADLAAWWLTEAHFAEDYPE